MGAGDNTLVSFQRAMDVGADMVELDVRRTRDGVLVCHHDATLGVADLRLQVVVVLGLELLDATPVGPLVGVRVGGWGWAWG